MGSFSWTRADTCTKRANISGGDKYKILIPKVFGGGFIKDVYLDYGYVFFDDTNENDRYYEDGLGHRYPSSDFKRNDLYGILAYWNSCMHLKWMGQGQSRPIKMYDILKRGMTCDGINRGAGIDIGCYDDQINKLNYPLKLVSLSFNGTYEDCAGRSYGDPNQGFFAANWSHPDYIGIYKCLQSGKLYG